MTIFRCGEKGTAPVQVRFSPTEKERLEFLCSQAGYKTLSQYIRAQCLNPAIEGKLNQILEILKEKAEKK